MTLTTAGRSERTQQSYELGPGASVEVSGIAGPVEIETASGDTAEVNVTRSAPTHADLECGKIAIEQTSTRLRIRSESLCPIVRGQQRVMLKLPRRVDLDLQNIAGDVRIGATDGMVRLESIAGQVVVAELRAAKMSSLAQGLSLTIADVGDRGIRVSSVTGGIDLGVDVGVDAELSVRSVVGRVHSEAADIRIARENDSDCLVQIGSGGSKFLIEGVVGPVRIHRARVTIVVRRLFPSERGSVSRTSPTRGALTIKIEMASFFLRIVPFRLVLDSAGRKTAV